MERKLISEYDRFTSVFKLDDNSYEISKADDWGKVFTAIKFQQGPIKENGINGIRNEDLLAIVIDRLETWQNGPYRCDENETALLALKEAVDALSERTARRKVLGIEGTSVTESEAEALQKDADDNQDSTREEKKDA